jgi:hypothetical protein
LPQAIRKVTVSTHTTSHITFTSGSDHSLHRVRIADTISHFSAFDCGTLELNECIFSSQNSYQTRRDFGLFPSCWSRSTALPLAIRGSLGHQYRIQVYSLAHCIVKRINSTHQSFNSNGQLLTDMYTMPPIRFAPLQIANASSSNGDAGHPLSQSQTPAQNTNSTHAASAAPTQGTSGR